MNSFSKLISFLIGFILMFLTPLFYFTQKNDTLSQCYASQTTANFANDVSQHGYVTSSMLSRYLKQLSNTNQTYQVEMIHRKLCLEPEYKLLTEEEIIAKQKEELEKQYQEISHELISERPLVEDVKPEGILINEESNQSVLDQSAYLPPSKEHVHTKECYRNYTDLMCEWIIKSIIPTHPVQTINQGDPLITTATVTYLDGSSEVVVCSTKFESNTVANDQTAYLSYIGYADANKKQTFDMTVKVNVRSLKQVCAYGHEYWKEKDGSDPGCPYCKSWPQKLELVSKNKLPLVVAYGSQIEDAHFTFLATYFDGHQETVMSDYTHNFVSTYIGMQMVTVGYKGAYCHIPIKTEAKTAICSICKQSYTVYHEDSIQVCPHCMTKIPQYTNHTMRYYKESTLDDIMSELNVTGRYTFAKGDEVTIHIYSNQPSIAQELLRLIGVNDHKGIHVWKTFRIRDEKR